MSSDGHGIPDSAALAAHQVVGHADQEQHQNDLERKRSGLSDEAVDGEGVFIKGVERRASLGEEGAQGVGSKIKEKISNLIK